MAERYQVMVDLGGGCGLRQGEILGVAVEAIDFCLDTLHVVQQLNAAWMGLTLWVVIPVAFPIAVEIRIRRI